MLKPATMRFMKNSHSTTMANGFSSDRPIADQAPKKTPAIARLVSGPMIAMANSCSGRFASPPI